MTNLSLLLSSINYKLIVKFLWYCLDSCTKTKIQIQIFIAHDNCLIGVKYFFYSSISYPEYTYAITVIESSRTWTFLWIEGNSPYAYSLYLVRYENKSFYFSVKNIWQYNHLCNGKVCSKGSENVFIQWWQLRTSKITTFS